MPANKRTFNSISIEEVNKTFNTLGYIEGIEGLQCIKCGGLFKKKSTFSTHKCSF